MKEVGGSEHPGAVVETKSSSGCLIVEKKAAYGLGGVGLGFSDSSSKKSSSSNKEKKRYRVVVSDSESSDELGEPVRRKIYEFIGNDNFKTEKKVNNVLDESDERRIKKDERRIKKDDRLIVDNKRNLDNKSEMLGAKSSENAMNDDDFDLPLSMSNENDKDFDEPEKNGAVKIMVNKHKRKESRTSLQSPSKVKVVKRDGNIKTPTKNVTSVKGKESKIKGASCTEKQMLREKIKKMLFGAGWTIDYRPRRNRDYLDSVYISPAGTAYWSITKAYETLRKEEKDSSKASGDFTPLPNEILSKLTRQTRKKIEREVKKDRKHEGGNSRKFKSGKVKKSALDRASDQPIEKLGSYMRHSQNLSENRLKEANEETPQKERLKKATLRTNSHIAQERKSGNIGRLALLVRGFDTGLNSEDDGLVSYTGKRTVLSWLIDSGMISVGEKVEYMNLRKTRVMQEGWITKDGIHCDCCSKVVTILRFELHAGSKLGQPFQNIFIKSGQSLMQCQIDAWNKQEESERKGFYAVDVDDDPNDDTCGLCGDGGDLICCDGCPSTFHLSCLDMQMLPQGDWHCPNCACKYCDKVGGYGTKTSGKRKNSLLSCHLCEKKCTNTLLEERYHKSCSLEMEDKPINSNNLNFPFCGQNCRELYSRLQKLLWIKHELDSGFSWSLIHRSDPLPDVSSINFSQRVECNSKLAIALSVMDECFLPIVDRRSGITLIHNVVYNCGSNFSRLNYGGFFTAILERGDEMICAASIRIHGTQLAEMPFIGTRHLYRRQGMCSRLLHAIESALFSLEVEKLVIPAIEEHMHTWTNAFGFCPLEKSQKHKMRAINMLVFHGTDILQKPLMKQSTPEGKRTLDKGKKGNEVDDHSKLVTKDSRLNDAVMQNVDCSNGNPSEPEVPSGKKSDTQSVTVVLKGMVHDGNETTGGSAGADSGSKVETIGLQNDNETATRIIDVNSLRTQVLDVTSHDTASTEVSCQPQLQVTEKDSVSIDVRSDSIAGQNGNVTNLLLHPFPDIPLELNLQLPGKESTNRNV